MYPEPPGRRALAEKVLALVARAGKALALVAKRAKAEPVGKAMAAVVVPGDKQAREAPAGTFSSLNALPFASLLNPFRSF